LAVVPLPPPPVLDDGLEDDPQAASARASATRAGSLYPEVIVGMPEWYEIAGYAAGTAAVTVS
jgi:hypothetical protein